MNSFGLYASPRGGRREAPSRNETRGLSQLGGGKWKSPVFLKTILSRGVFLFWKAPFSENYFVQECFLIVNSRKPHVFLCSWILWQWSLFWSTRGGWNKPFGLSILSLEVSPNVCLKRTNIDKSKVSNLTISLPSVHLWSSHPFTAPSMLSIQS